MLHFLPLLILLTLTTSTTSTDPTYLSTLPPDPSALLLFKSKSDLDNKLLYSTKTQSNFCQWQGVKCAQGRVVRYVIQNLNLRGTFPAGSLSKLDQLRVLILRDNNLSGPIPDLSSLINLKTLLIDHNLFSGDFPASLLSLHRLTVLDLSFNNFTGELSVSLNRLDQLNSLRLDSNRFYGMIPALNQADLNIFNVSGNNFSGPIPVTSTLKKFKVNSFLFNPNLCGNIINKPCKDSPFFNSSGEASSPSPLLTEQSQQGITIVSPPAGEKKHHKKVGLILGFLTGGLILVAAVLSIVALVRKRREEREEMEGEVKQKEESNFPDEIETTGIPSKAQKDVTVLSPLPRVEIANAAIEKMMVKSGRLLFCSGDEEVYTLEQLMRASAELLGRGTIGTTYKAVMADQFVVSVKRLDAGKTSITSGDAFEQHLEKVGMLRHPNLVPVRAYFQAKQERLVIFDYQRNGSLYNLIHGSRSTRAKPLHWTSCLKIAEDVAQGLAYIHQASTFVHGNLKSSNVLLGSDFEACITDYCLAMLADTSSDEDPDFLAYKAPEIRKSSRKANAKSDVYAFGVLLLELLTGKPPAQHPFLAPPDMPDWVRAMREDNSEDDTRLRMLVEVASICSMTSPEQRPTMWQVLKMITNVKEIMDDSSSDVLDGYS